MKLLTFTASSEKDGSSVSLLNTLVGLKKKGVEICVIVPKDGWLTERLKEENIDYFICTIPYWAWPRVGKWYKYWKIPFKLTSILFNELRSYYKLKRIIKFQKPDLLHTNVSVINIGVLLSYKLHIPHVWHIREYGDKDFNIHSLYGKKRLRKKLYNSKCICITHDLKKYYELGENARVIYNGIEEDSNCKNKEIKELGRIKKRIIFVGRLTEEKGVTEIVESFISFCGYNNDYHIDLIGSCKDRYRAFLLNKIKNHNLSDRIKLVGHVQNPYEQMRQSGAIVVASKSEGFGRITAEAMLNGCLVIGKDTAGTKEQFDNGLTLCGDEIGIRYGGDKSLEEALREYSKLSDDRLTGISNNARITVKKLYSVDQNVDNIYKYLQEVIGAK